MCSCRAAAIAADAARAKLFASEAISFAHEGTRRGGLDMGVQVHMEADNVAVLAMPSDVILEDVGEMKSLAADLVSRGVQRVILDFRGVERIDSRGLGQVVVFYTKLRDANIPLAIVTGRAIVRELFSLTNLDKIMPVFDSMQDALANG
jgi:anti-sigma B factor antagonist